MLLIEFLFAAAVGALSASLVGCCALVVFKLRERRKARADAPFSSPSDWGDQ